MRTRRSRVVLCGTFLTLIVGLIPLGMSAILGSYLAHRSEQNKLDLLAKTAVDHADSTFDAIRQILITLNNTPFAICSPEHRDRLRSLSVASEDIEDIAYFDGDRALCTSWRVGPIPIHRSDIGFTTIHGDLISLRYRPTENYLNDMIGIRTGRYEALTLPSRLLDFNVTENATILLLNKYGTVISERNADGPILVVDQSEREKLKTGEIWLSSSAQKDELSAVVLENHSFVWPQMRANLEFYTPIGLVFSMIAMGFSVKYWRRQLSQKAELELAIRKREFVVFYQPIIRLVDGKCMGGEALVRWKRPNGDIVGPDSFIPLAEATGLIGQITDQVIHHVIRDLNQVLVQDRSLHVTINLTPEDIETGRALNMLDAVMLYSGIEKRQIWLEVTERSFINADNVRETLIAARASGYIVALDDFGTGYSSLQHLQGLPLDALKIDRSFVSAVKMQSTRGSLIPHIDNIARELGLFSVAEGIETEEQLVALRLIGIEFGQGWLFAKPMPLEEFLVFLATCKAREAV